MNDSVIAPSALLSVSSTLSAVELVVIDETRDQQRVDNFLFYYLKKVPKSLIYKIIRKGAVRVNNQRIAVSFRLSIGDNVRIPPMKLSMPITKKPLKPIPLSKESILFEDEGLLILNKPSGIAVHGGSGIRAGLIESVRCLWPQYPFLELVHRLDRETSGCLMIAKKRSMLRFLHEALRQGNVQKKYQALVIGKWPSEKKMVTARLKKNILFSGERKVTVSDQGKASQTQFEVLSYATDCTLLNVTLHTGRTHQIRVHASNEGYPIIGDEKYGDKKKNHAFKALGINRLMLHACQLCCELPDGTRLKISAPLPAMFDECMTRADPS